MEKIHTDFIDETDGTVTGRHYETFYNVCKSIQQEKEYLRVFADSDFTDFETRIPYELLEKAGFKKVETVTEEISSGMDAFDELDLPEGATRLVLEIGGEL